MWTTNCSQKMFLNGFFLNYDELLCCNFAIMLIKNRNIFQVYILFFLHLSVIQHSSEIGLSLQKENSKRNIVAKVLKYTSKYQCKQGLGWLYVKGLVEQNFNFELASNTCFVRKKP